MTERTDWLIISSASGLGECVDEQNESQEDAPVQRTVRVRWPLGSHGETVFSNAALVQHQGDVFIISFGFLLPPGAPIISRDEFEQIDSLDVDVVARVVVTPETMEETITAMTENLNRWKARRAAAQGAPE